MHGGAPREVAQGPPEARPIQQHAAWRIKPGLTRGLMRVLVVTIWYDTENLGARMHVADLPNSLPNSEHDPGRHWDVPVPSRTSLDHIESELQSGAEQCPSALEGHCTCAQTFRHSGWSRDRHRVYAGLKATGASDATLERFGDCGAYAWVFENPAEPGDYRIGSSRCKNRWCMPCANQRSRTMRNALTKYVAGKTIRFLTLTVKNKPATLADRLDHLNSSFRALRRSKAWRAAVDGGVAFLEIKAGQNQEYWHPHLHVVIEGKYIAHSTLVKLWRAITGDSYIIDIRAIRSRDQLTRYITKYVTKPLEAALLRSPEKLIEAMKAIRGRKIAATFGSWRGLKLTDTEPLDDWLPIAPLNRVIHDALDGDANAIAMMQILEKGQISWNQDETGQSRTQTDRSRDGPS